MTSHRSIRVQAVVLVASAVVVLSGCGGGTPAPVASSPSPSTASTATPSATPNRSASSTNAVGSLDRFFTAVDASDRALSKASATVNAGIGTSTVTFTPSTLAAVRRAAPSSVAKAVPKGLGAAVESAVLLVYSDLESRYASLKDADCLRRGTFPRAQLARRCFAASGPAAKRLSRDVAAARTAAENAASVSTPAPGSRASADTAIRIAYIDGRNSGCGSAGGYLATTPIPVRWYPTPSKVTGSTDFPVLDGEVGPGGSTVPFVATRTPGGSWSIRLRAC